MKHLFVPYEIAKQLKEKGFNEPCIGYLTEGDYFDFNQDFDTGKNQNDYSINSELASPNIAAPLYQQVVDWFREKHKLIIYVRVPG